MSKEIIEKEDIKLLVNSFYDKVRNDEMLSKIFNDVIKDRWPEHLGKMVRFWETVLLEDRTYFGSPFPPHANLPVNSDSFERWIRLFKETIEENFIGAKAEEALWRAEKMAAMFMQKINYHQNNPGKLIL